MTLIESCLTVAIISTAMTISIPPLIHARDGYLLNAAASDVESKLHAARIHAIAGSQDCRLRVTSTTSYLVECQAPTPPSTWFVTESVELPRGITVTANARPEFHRRGNVAPAATVSVWDASGKTKRVVVNIAGRVKIQ
jgi:hypothetical protein